VLRLVADTNIVVSALLWRGAPHRLFEAVEREELSFCASRALIDELAEVLARRKLARAVGASGKSISALVTEYQALVQLVQPRALGRTALREIRILMLRSPGATAHNAAYVASRAAIGKKPHGNLSARRTLGNGRAAKSEPAPRAAGSGDVWDGVAGCGRLCTFTHEEARPCPPP